MPKGGGTEEDLSNRQHIQRNFWFVCWLFLRVRKRVRFVRVYIGHMWILYMHVRPGKDYLYTHIYIDVNTWKMHYYRLKIQ